MIHYLKLKETLNLLNGEAQQARWNAAAEESLPFLEKEKHIMNACVSLLNS
jgi:hypothetical protein